MSTARTVIAAAAVGAVAALAVAALANPAQAQAAPPVHCAKLVAPSEKKLEETLGGLLAQGATHINTFEVGEFTAVCGW